MPPVISAEYCTGKASCPFAKLEKSVRINIEACADYRQRVRFQLAQIVERGNQAELDQGPTNNDEPTASSTPPTCRSDN